MSTAHLHDDHTRWTDGAPAPTLAPNRAGAFWLGYLALVSIGTCVALAW